MSRKWRNRIRLIVCLLLVLCGAAYLLFQLRYAPLVKKAAMLKMDNDAAGIINDAIESVVESGKVDYNKLVMLEKGSDGTVTVLKSNMAAVNELKYEILDAVSQRILDFSTEEITLPAGSIFFPEFFSGHGPEIPIRLATLRSSGAQLESRFSDAGINQTRHEIVVVVSVEVTIVTPAGTIDVPVSSNAVVAETIIVGGVPETFVTVGGS